MAVGFVPAIMPQDGSTEPLRPDDPGAEEVTGYAERPTDQCSFDTTFSRQERAGFLEPRAAARGQPHTSAAVSTTSDSFATSSS